MLLLNWHLWKVTDRRTTPRSRLSTSQMPLQLSPPSERRKKQKEKKETTTTTPAAAVVVVEDAAGTESSSSDTESSSSNETESSSEEDTTFFAANLDEGGTLSKWKRILSAVPKIEKGTDQNSGKKSWKNGIRIGDDIDRRIASLALPSMLNLAVVPIVNSVDTFWVGRMGNALALAGQGAANQAFFTIYFLVAFLPMITAPLVATAVGSGDTEAAQDAICESLFLSNLLGGIGTLLMVLSPRTVLKLVLSSKTAPAMQYAAPYLRYRSLSMIPALFSATGFSAYRGLLNTVTPLKVSLTTNALNLIADPLFIFRPLKLGFVGAAVATALAECTGGLIYLKLLLKRNLVSFSKMFKPPSMQRLIPLIKGGAAILIRQLTINIAFLTASRRAQGMDPTGVTAAAYGIVMQIYYLGVVIHLAIQSTAAALVPSAKAMSGDQAARKVADRIFFWASITGFAISACQLAALPVLVPLFSTLPEVQEAVKIPAILSSLIHLLNGPVFAGEGVMLGLGTFGALASVTAIGVSAMFAILLSPLGKTLDGILISIAAFSFLQAIGVFVHYIRFGPLRRRGFFSKQQTN